MGTFEILVLDQPLVDQTAYDVPLSFFEAHGLPQDGFRLFESYPSQLINGLTVAATAGGAGINTARIVGALTKGDPEISVTAVGRVSTPDSQFFSDILSSDGVRFQPVLAPPEERSGVCLVLVSGASRCLCTYLGAAATFDADYSPPPHDLLFTTAFFIQSAPGFIKQLTGDSRENKLFAVNLGAPSAVLSIGRAEWLAILEHTNFLFGSREEFQSLQQHLQIFTLTDLIEKDFQRGDGRRPGAEFVSQVMGGRNDRRQPKFVVMTDGPHDVVIAGAADPPSGEFCAKKYPPLPTDEIRDTNAAGDAFVGGFLFGVAEGVRGRADWLPRAATQGLHAARFILGQTGCAVTGLTPSP